MVEMKKKKLLLGALALSALAFVPTSAQADTGVHTNNPESPIEGITYQKIYMQGNGGAITNLNNSNALSVNNSVFTSNATLTYNSDGKLVYYGNGGAIYNAYSQPEDNALVAEIKNSTFTKNGSSSGGGIWNNSSLNSTGNTFTSNVANYGGAIYNAATGKVSVTNTEFTSNSANGYGGAIANNGELKLSSENSFTSNTATSYGGAICNLNTLTIGDNDSTSTKNTFTNNTATYGGAIYNQGTLTINKNTEFISNGVKATDNTIVTTNGGAIYNGSGKLIASGSTFDGNKANNAGGAIINFATAELTDNTFKNNSATSLGGAIHNQGKMAITGGEISSNEAANGGAIFSQAATDGYLTIDGTLFRGNKATESAGGAIYSTNESDGGDGILTVSNAKFNENEAVSEGGAIWSGAQTSISGSTFEKNKTTGTNYNTGSYLTDNEGGGAVFIGSSSNVTISNSKFTTNSSETVGGAIATRSNASSANSSLTISNSEFTGNTAAINGGAILTYVGATIKDATVAAVDEDGTQTIAKTVFSDNYAAQNGGAIYSKGLLKIDGTTFTNNGSKTVTTEATEGSEATSTTYTTQLGGAIANMGTSSKVTLNKATFDTNSANMGGAISNQGTIIDTGSTFENNTATLAGGAIFSSVQDVTTTLKFTDSTFKNNSTTGFGGGGAIYMISADATFDNVSFTQNQANAPDGTDLSNGDDKYSGGAIFANLDNVISIQNSNFEENSASKFGGAIQISGAKTVNIGKTNFISNQAKNGGAISTSMNSAVITISDSLFEKNSANGAGAIGNFSAGDGTNVGMTISNTTFKNNEATNENDYGGGALFLGGTSTTSISGGKFEGNTSASVGGAISSRINPSSSAKLTINDVEFTNNTAGTDGGAIYNTISDATITKGSFSGNYATENGGAIYTTGLLKIDGTTFTNNGSKTVTTEATDESEATSTTYTTQLGGAIYNAYTAPAEEDIVLLASDDTADNEVLSTEVLTSEIKGATFTGNTAQNGGAVFNEGDLTISGTTFGGTGDGEGNIAVLGGGAIYNDGDLTVSGSSFENNEVTGNDYYYGDGGAIYNMATMTVNDNTFSNNTADGRGGAIYNVGTANVNGGSFSKNIATNLYGGGIYNTGVLNINVPDENETTTDDGTYLTSFSENSAQYGGAIENSSAGVLNVVKTIFTSNVAGVGGAIDSDGVVTVSDSKFSNNIATSGAAAIYAGNKLTINNSEFIENGTPDNAGSGGAIFVNTDSDVVSTITNSTFVGNNTQFYTTYDPSNDDKYLDLGAGGAIYLGNGQLSISGEITKNDETGNNEYSTYFSGNKSDNGGAICIATNKEAIATIDSVLFSENEVSSSGGAISNYGVATITNVTFDGNKANTVSQSDLDGGGALFVGSKSETTIKGSTFSNNSAVTGGAIGGRDTDQINTAAKLSIEDSTFDSNTATGNGGAIANTFSNTTVTGTTFTGNTAGGNGGAIYNDGADNKGEGILSNIKLATSTFKGNTAQNGGAVFNDGDLTISGTTFGGTGDGEGNIAVQGGAIQNNETLTLNEGNTFTSNSASYGGAIFNFGDLEVTKNEFTSNSADYYGGAIFNEGGDLVITGGSFTKNSANQDGGAIYNDVLRDSKTGELVYPSLEITDTSFTDNTATGNGGAIYTNGDLTISAVDENVVFSGNSANDGNDIYMNKVDGAETSILALNAADGKSISLDGGISGNEKYNLNINSDSANTGSVIVKSEIKNATTTVDNGILQLDEGAKLTETSLAMQSGSTLNVNTDVTIGDNDNAFVSDGATLNLAANTTANNATLTDTVINATKGNSEFNLAGESSVTSATLAKDTSLTLNSENKLTISSVTGDSSATSALKLNQKEGNTGSVVFDGSVEKVNVDVANGTLQLDEDAKLTKTSLAMQSGSTLNVNTDVTIGDENNAFVSNGATLNLAANTTANNATLTDTVINTTKGNSEFNLASESSVTSATLAKDTSLTLNSENKLTIGSVTGADKTSSKLNLNQNEGNKGVVSVTSKIDNTAIDIQNGELVLANKAFIDSSTLNVGNATLHAINNSVETYGSNITLNSSTLTADIDLAAKTADNFANAAQNGKMTVSSVNFMNGVNTTSHSVNFDLAEAMGLKNGVEVTKDAVNQTTTFLNPIRYLTGGVTENGMVSFMPTGNGYKDFNPAIMASPVAAQLGGYLTQLNSYDEAFRNMDMYMLMTKEQRYVLKNRNKFAISEGQTSYDPTYDSKYGWARPYATFESVRLKNGPKVSNVAYGSFFGGESEMYDLGHGWDGMLGVYAGYNGSHQAYDGIGIYQNGGTLGVTGMAYKGNFFTGLTINAGANVGEASTAYGSDNFTMLMAGIASKTGYNVELADGKFIIQPSFLMSYSFVNTFDYTNAAGIRIDSDPLHAIQLEPGLKFIGNLKNGWQPYVGVSMVWNIMDKTNFNANEASLPDLSVKPYVKYGVGVRKTWGERLSGFIQAFFTNGGRNGLGLQAGFRFAIGKEGAPVKVQNSKPEMPKTQIKLSGLK